MNKFESCDEPGGIPDLNIDQPPGFCLDPETERRSGTLDTAPHLTNQKQTSNADLDWLKDVSLKKKGLGFSALCDPQQTGHIVNNQGMDGPNMDVVYRYSKSLKGTDEGMLDLFRDIIVIDENGKVHQVPIMWATQEKAVAAIIQDNVRKDDSGVIDRIKLPILSIHSSGFEMNQKRYTYHKALDFLRDSKRDWQPGFTVNEKFDRDTVFGVSRGVPLDIQYTLYAWTLYEEDMKQILTQIVTKCTPMAYIRISGVSQRIAVQLNSIANNVNVEPGDKAVRVFKYQFGFTAESFVAQPVVRQKAVLKTRIEVVNSPNDPEITEVLTRLEQAVKELEE